MSMVTSSGPQVFLWMVSLVNLDPLELTATDSTASISGMVVPRVRPIEIFSISADTDNLQNRNADYLQIQIICRYGFIGRYQNYLPIFLNLQILLAGITDNICRYGVYLQIWVHICRYCRYTDMPIWKNYICYLQIYIGKLICRYYRQISLSVVL